MLSFSTSWAAVDAGRRIVSAEEMANGPIQLTGQWEFYWNGDLPLGFVDLNGEVPDATPTVPSSWTQIPDSEGNTFPAKGSAVYRLQVDLTEEHGALGLYVPKIWCASQVYVNGQLVSERGEIDAPTYRNLILEKLVSLPPSSKVDIVVLVRSDLSFVAGLLEPFQLGDYQTLKDQQQSHNILNLMWIGCVFIIAIYHFVLYLKIPTIKSFLFFGVIAALIGIKLSVFGDHQFYAYLKDYQGGILNDKWQSALYYLSTDLLPGFGLLYLHALFPKQANRKLIAAFFILTVPYCLFVLLTPFSVFASTLMPFQAVALAAAGYCAFIVVFASVKREKGALLQLGGIAIMLLAGLNDALFTVGIELTGNIELLPVAFALLLLLQLFVAADKFSCTLKELQDLSSSLEEKVDARTAEIDQKNKQIELQNLDLIYKNEALAKINESKDNLMQVVAHDIKAPINNIKGLIDLLTNTENLSKEQKQLVDLIDQARLSSEELISDLVQQQNKEASNSDGIVQLDLAEFLLDKKRTHRHAVSEKSIEIIISPCTESCLIAANQQALSRILDNLLSNAIKFSPPNSKIQLKAGVLENGWGEISVADEGPGFSEEDQELAFQRFQKLSARPTAGESSTGLGLYIVKSLVDDLGGRIQLHSTPGAGSEFELTFPPARVGERN